MITTKIVEPEGLEEEIKIALEAAKQGQIVIVLLPEQAELAKSLGAADSLLSALRSVTTFEGRPHPSHLQEAS
jgi:hypothetical protein